MPSASLIEAIRTKIGQALDETPTVEKETKKEPTPPKKRRRRRKTKMNKPVEKAAIENLGVSAVAGIGHSRLKLNGKFYLLWNVKDEWFIQDERTRKAKKKAVFKISGKSASAVMEQLAYSRG